MYPYSSAMFFHLLILGFVFVFLILVLQFNGRNMAALIHVTVIFSYVKRFACTERYLLLIEPLCSWPSCSLLYWMLRLLMYKRENKPVQPPLCFLTLSASRFHHTDLSKEKKLLLRSTHRDIKVR